MHGLPEIWELHYLDPLVLQVICELMRYVTGLPYLLPHKTTQDAELGGYFVGKGAQVSGILCASKPEVLVQCGERSHAMHFPIRQVWCNLFSLNHDPEYWEDPWTFNPERFLDEQGQLVGPDHPNRRR